MGIVNKKQTGSKRYLMKNDSLKGQHRINEQIRAKEVRIVGDEVEPKVYPIAQALRLAEEHEADLVEISPNAQPPVCRIIDYSKFLYQLKKRQKEQKAKQVKVNVKEGDRVEAGQALAVVEAMKMQNELYAQKPCVVKKVYFKPGQNLALDDVIMDFDTSA